jgi:hypothetical protein
MKLRSHIPKNVISNKASGDEDRFGLQLRQMPQFLLSLLLLLDVVSMLLKRLLEFKAHLCYFLFSSIIYNQHGIGGRSVGRLQSAALCPIIFLNSLSFEWQRSESRLRPNRLAVVVSKWIAAVVPLNCSPVLVNVGANGTVRTVSSNCVPASQQ